MHCDFAFMDTTELSSKAHKIKKLISGTIVTGNKEDL